MTTQSLSKRKRQVYLFFCIVAFFIFAPIVALYATGYRFGEKFDVTKTGGIYIVTQGKDFDVYLNSKRQDTSSVFRRNIFLQDVRPDTYELMVLKKGLMAWHKNIVVLPEKVNEVSPFNLPENIKVVKIPKTITTASGVSTSTTKNNEEYSKVKLLFDKLDKKLSNSKATTTIRYKKISLFHEKNIIYVKWNGDNDFIPNFFCNDDKCDDTLIIKQNEAINQINFFQERDDVIIFSTNSGIYVTELDGNGGRNIQPVILGSYEFIIDENGVIYLKKDSKTFYMVGFGSNG